jgi:vacuolar-type H+-ATPase subunit I/STV1
MAESDKLAVAQAVRKFSFKIAEERPDDPLSQGLGAAAENEMVEKKDEAATLAAQLRAMASRYSEEEYAKSTSGSSELTD